MGAFARNQMGRSRWSLAATKNLFDPSTEPPSRSREILIRPLSPSAVFESRGRHNHAPRSLLPGNHRGSGVSS